MSARAVVLQGGRLVRVDWPDGRTREISGRWLFDHAEGARDPVSGQRGQGALASEGVAVARIEVEAGTLRALFSPAGVERRIGLDRLRDPDPPNAPIELWPSPEAIAGFAPIAFDGYLHEDSALREALSQVARRGLVLLSGAGDDPKAVERAVRRFGFVRETNYGRAFDVRIEPAPGNLAYSDRGLDLHTDNPYRNPAPTLQLLHAIAADGSGGETLFVDGFAHADALRSETPGAFEVLARQPVRFSYRARSGERWSAVHPVLTLDGGGGLQAVRLNHRSLDLAPGPAEAIEAWYDAYLAYYHRVHAPEAAFERRLEPGELVIFDNRRVLHGRRALTRASPRWLRGCYADADGLAATLSRLDLTASEEARDASRLRG